MSGIFVSFHFVKRQQPWCEVTSEEDTYTFQVKIKCAHGEQRNCLERNAGTRKRDPRQRNAGQICA